MQKKNVTEGNLTTDWSIIIDRCTSKVKISENVTICVDVVFVVCWSLFLNLYVCVSRWNFSTDEGTRILGKVCAAALWNSVPVSLCLKPPKNGFFLFSWTMWTTSSTSFPPEKKGKNTGQWNTVHLRDRWPTCTQDLWMFFACCTKKKTVLY